MNDKQDIVFYLVVCGLIILSFLAGTLTEHYLGQKVAVPQVLTISKSCDIISNLDFMNDLPKRDISYYIGNGRLNTHYAKFTITKGDTKIEKTFEADTFGELMFKINEWQKSITQ